MKILPCLLALLPALIPAQEKISDPRNIADAPTWDLRRTALHNVLASHNLSDAWVRREIIHLFNRETGDPEWEELEAIGRIEQRVTRPDSPQ